MQKNNQTLKSMLLSIFSLGFLIISIPSVRADYPTLISPVDDAILTDATPLFEWEPPEGIGVVNYHIQLWDEAEPANLILDDDTIPDDEPYYQCLTTLPDAENYGWWVRYKSKAWSEFSPEWHFAIQTTVPPFDLSPSLVNPTNGANTNNSTPEFSWNIPRGANLFHIQVADSETFASLNVNSTTSSDSFTPSSPLAIDDYWWRVRAKNDTTTWGTWSSVWQVTIEEPDYWELIGTPIVIDDNGGTSGSITWTEATAEPWCSFSEDTYIIENVKIDGLGTEDGIEIYDSTVSFIIQDCHVTNTINDGIYLYNVANGIIINNNISENGNNGLNLYYDCMNNEIAFNTFGYNDADGFHIRANSANNLIHHNTFWDNGASGIRTYQAGNDNLIEENSFYQEYRPIFNHVTYNTTITRNHFYECSFGIYLRFSHETFVIENNFTDCMYDGLHFYGTARTIVQNNIFQNNGRNGIYFEGSCRWNNLSENLFRNNQKFGVFIENIAAANNTITNNTFEANSWGNAYDNGTDSTDLGATDWDGNIWGDYEELVGGNAKDIDDDGIGDEPYPINGTALNADHSPHYWDPIVFMISAPSHLQPFGKTSPIFSFTIPEGIPVMKWYSFDGGETTAALLGNNSIPQVDWLTQDDGNMNITILFIDNHGFQTLDSVEVMKDATDPIVTILSPESGANFGETPPNFEFSVSDAHLDSHWYTLNQGDRCYLCEATGSINADAWEDLEDGEITLSFYTNDTFGNIGMDDVIITKDTAPAPPPHTLSSPSIISPNGGEILEETVHISWTAAEDSLNHTVVYDLYYTFDGGTSWVVIVENITTTEWEWDITLVPDGNSFKILVIARSLVDSLEAEDLSDATFSIQKEPGETSSTNTSESSTETTSTEDTSPSRRISSFSLLMLMCITLLSVGALLKSQSWKFEKGKIHL